MDSVNFNSSTHKPLVLVAPLDWGLGHTTRCIPLIRELLDQGCNIIIACNSIQKRLLHQEFADNVRYTYLAGYDISYGKRRSSTVLKLMLQAGKILTKIKQENRWLQAFLTTHPVDAIVSDNRFGLYASGIHSIFITHQLQIKTGLGSLADRIARQWNYRKLQHFNSCWVPDQQDLPGLAGALSHPRKWPSLPITYVGTLSRLRSCERNGQNGVLILLSGPEPQRSILETMLLQQVASYPGKITLIRGLPLSSTVPPAPVNCTILNHVPASILHTLLCDASLVISRCGYTTVMDLLVMQKRTLLIPTPGQAEQEYLAQHLKEHRWAYTLPQQAFQLIPALAAAEVFNYCLPTLDSNGYKNAIRALAASLKQKGRL